MAWAFGKSGLTGAMALRDLWSLGKHVTEPGPSHADAIAHGREGSPDR